MGIRDERVGLAILIFFVSLVFFVNLSFNIEELIPRISSRTLSGAPLPDR